MPQNQTDELGRATFHHIAPKKNIRPTEREIRWLKHIERHGPQSSVYLHELTKDTHRCKDTSLRQLQKLRAGGYLSLPHQQRQIVEAKFHPYIYDLTKQAKTFLKDEGLAEDTIRPTGHWWHAYNVSCITSAIDITTAHQNIRFIPAHQILQRSNSTFAVPIGKAKLIPDQLFALDHCGKFRAYLLEVDRGTEPLTSPSKRKSIKRALELYEQAYKQKFGKTHYGLNANLLTLWVFSRQSKMDRFLEMVPRYAPNAMDKLFALSLHSENILSSISQSHFVNSLGNAIRMIE